MTLGCIDTVVTGFCHELHFGGAFMARQHELHSPRERGRLGERERDKEIEKERERERETEREITHKSSCENRANFAKYSS